MASMLVAHLRVHGKQHHRNVSHDGRCRAMHGTVYKMYVIVMVVK